jgi:hypothetical protein
MAADHEMIKSYAFRAPGVAMSGCPRISGAFSSPFLFREINDSGLKVSLEDMETWLSVILTSTSFSQHRERSAIGTHSS